MSSSFSFLSFMFCFFIPGCTIFRSITGTNIDPVRFEKAREARMMEVRQQAALRLAERLSTGDPFDKGDITILFSSEAIDKIVQQYAGTHGWLDSHTHYTVRKVAVHLFNGSAILSFDLLAHSDRYGLDIELIMDCILTFQIANDELETIVEPFNITPSVTAEGILSAFDDILADVIKIRLTELSRNIPHVRFPIVYSSPIHIRELDITTRAKVNISLKSPRRIVNSRFNLKELLFFNHGIVVVMTLTMMGVK